MTPREKTLIVLLRLTGLAMVSAVVFVFCPLNWMDSIHRILGLGPLPTGPIVEYLARTESALYACMGVMLCFISFDVSRYRPFIRLAAWITILFSIWITFLDARLGLPFYWTASEGPLTALWGAAILLLAKTPDRKKSE